MSQQPDLTPRILRTNGRVEPLTKPLSVGAFAEVLGVQAFGLVPLPALGDKPRMVMVVDAMATDNALAVNRAATAVYHHSHPTRRTPIRGDVAILPDGHLGGFYA